MKAVKGGWTEIPILSGTTNTLLKTTTEITSGETLVLFNKTDGQKKQQINNVTSVTTGDGDIIYEADISSFSLTQAPTIAWKNVSEATWVSDVQTQEESDLNWKQYQLSVTERPEVINISNGTNSTMLETYSEIVTGEPVILYNSNDGFKEGELGSVSQTAISTAMALIEGGPITGIVVDNNDNVFVCGGNGYIIAKLDNNLKLLKQCSISSVRIYDITTYGENLFVCGGILGTDYKRHYYVAKLDSDLNLLNQYMIYKEGDSAFYRIKVSSSGGIYAIDSSYIAAFDLNLNLTGHYLLTNGDSTDMHMHISDIDAVSGYPTICGYIYDIDHNNGQYFHGHYFATMVGNNLNSRIIKDCDGLKSMFIDSSNNQFVCGTCGSRGYIANSSHIPEKQYTIYNSNGQIILYDINGGAKSTNIFVCGQATSNGAKNHYIAMLDEDLNLLKQYTIDSGNDDCLNKIAFDSNGNVFACGSSGEYGYIIKTDNNLSIPDTLPVGSVIFTATEQNYQQFHLDTNLSSGGGPIVTTPSYTGSQPSSNVIDQTTSISVGGNFKYTADISSFALVQIPIKAWKKPVDAYVSMETNPDRCLYEDEDISSKIHNATTSYFEFNDTRTNLLITGDKIIINGNEVTISNVAISGNTYQVTVPEQTSTITSVIIPSRLTAQTVSERQVIDNDYIQTTFKSVVKDGRALRVRIDGTKDTNVSKIQVDLWKQQ